MTMLFTLAQSGPDSPINQWLDQNPIVLGLIFLTIGGILIATGIAQLRKGVAVDKWGREHSGGMGQFISILRIIMGVIACGFAIYRIVFG